MIGSRVSLRTYLFEFRAWKNLKIYVPLVFTRSREVRITSFKKKKKENKLMNLNWHDPSRVFTRACRYAPEALYKSVQSPHTKTSVGQGTLFPCSPSKPEGRN